MKTIRSNLFKLVNAFMAVFGICTIFMNHVGVNVLKPDAAAVSMNGNNFEYATSDTSLMFKKNGELFGALPTEKKLSIRNDNMLFQSNAVVVVAKAVAAAAAGASFGAALVNGITNIIGPGAFAAAVSSIELPGSAAVAATLGGAGEAAATAAAADAALMAGGTAAVISSVVLPILAVAGVTATCL